MPTTLQYRIFGELEGSAFDQIYTCNPVGHPASVENTERIEIAEGVAQTLSRGNFGCPQPKEEFGFPEPAASTLSLTQDVAGIENSEPAVEAPAADDRSGNPLAIVALVLSVIAIVLGSIAIMRRRETVSAVE